MRQDQDLINLVTARQSKLENDKLNFSDRFQDIADYVLPHRDDMRGTLSKGMKKGTKIYDSTAVNAAVIATDGIHGYHVSPAYNWFKYVMNQEEANEVPEVQEFLEDTANCMYGALNISNFYNEMWMYIYDGFTVGTSVMYCEEDLKRGAVVFESVHPGEVYIAENMYGNVDCLHRKRKFTARQLVQRFGEEDLPVSVQQAFKDNPFYEYEIIHAVFPREEYDDRMKDAKNKKYASIWLLKDGNHLCKVSGFDEFPYSVWRYMKTGKEVYGVSPAYLAMPDIKAINLLSKTLLGAAQLYVDPPLNVPSYLEGKVQWYPRGLNYYNEGAKDFITPATPGGSFPVGRDREEALQRSIKERFHVDMFLMLAQIEGRGQRTAYEVSEMMAEKAAILGAELGPLNTELRNILELVYNIEKKAGRMPQVPDILYQMAAIDPALRFDPVYMGPLAQAQKEKFEKQGTNTFLSEISGIVQARPDALDNINVDQLIRVIGKSNSVPSEIFNTPEEVSRIRQQRLQAMQQETQIENAERMAGGLKTMSEVDRNTDGGIQRIIGGMNGAQA